MSDEVVLGGAALDADELVWCAAECLASLGYRTRSHVDGDRAVVEGSRDGLVDTVTGRRRVVVVRLERRGGTWHADARLTDWRHNLAFFAASALLGPVGAAGAAASAACRLFDDDARRTLLAHLGSAVRDKEVRA